MFPLSFKGEGASVQAIFCGDPSAQREREYKSPKI
jgi:hypothetical protein